MNFRGDYLWVESTFGYDFVDSVDGVSFNGSRFTSWVNLGISLELEGGGYRVMF